MLHVSFILLYLSRANWLSRDLELDFAAVFKHFLKFQNIRFLTALISQIDVAIN